MGTWFVDPAVVDYRLSITDCVMQTSNFRLPPSSDYRMPIVENSWNFADFCYFGLFYTLRM